jgi:hypothetical protein
MSTPSPDVTFQSFLAQIRLTIVGLPSETLARACGFLQRSIRKIPIPSLLIALVALGAETHLSLGRIASVIALAAGVSYSKQAFHKRLSAKIEGFLIHVATALFQHTLLPLNKRGWLGSFPRILLQDSTCEPLPNHLAACFPGSRNQKRKSGGTLKLQFITDLVGGSVLHWALSGFTRNDQAASVDILGVVRTGDLVLRDLGYSALSVFQQIMERSAFFLSRCKHGLKFYDPKTGRELNMARHLKVKGRLDRPLLVGQKEKALMRVVAEPVSSALANERRRRARQNRDKRLRPSPERLFLLGWNIFLTNVPVDVWPPTALFWVYRLRWRIEIIFKAWKSHLRLVQFNKRNERMVRLTVLTKLLYCMLVCRVSDTLESLCEVEQHVSVLRVARILGQCSCLIAAAIVGITPKQWLEAQLRDHIFYEQRNDRKNFYELVQSVNTGLG